MSHIRTIKTGTDRNIDISTGEIVSENDLTKDILVRTQEEWYASFSNLIQALHKLTGNEVKVLLWCAMNSRLNTNEVVLAKYIKERMGTELKLVVGSIENAIAGLVKKKLLQRLGRGVYHIDPDTTWRGDLKSRAKNIRVFLNYKIEQP
jgi:hypothetical protein